MRRRLDVVASLILSPPPTSPAPFVLFLDEPTTGLDPRSRAEIWATVRGLAAGGTTVLLSTQYLNEADELADDVVIIDAGRVIAQGTPDELKDAIGTRIDIVLADAADLAAGEGVLARWATGPPVTDADQRRLSAPVGAGTITLPELVRQLEAAGLRAEDVSVRRPTLDEVFLARTAGPREVAA
jgi:ABC-2 type transport system ATP-binding protein